MGYMGAHGPYVGWKFLMIVFKVKCPIGINKNKISYYFYFVQHQLCVHFFIITLLCFLFVTKPC
jgi:hypothetical protein